MSSWMGPNAPAWNGVRDYRVYAKTGDIVAPPPTDALVFIDERSDSIDDGYFAVNLTTWNWQNVPASRHGNGGVFSFADGHGELWRWVEEDTRFLKRDSSGFRASKSGSKNRDLRRLKEASNSAKDIK